MASASPAGVAAPPLRAAGGRPTGGVLHRCDAAEATRCTRLNAECWSKPFESADAYAVCEAWLRGTHPFTTAGGAHTYWALRGEDGAHLAACEAYRVPCAYADQAQGGARTVGVAHAIASVYTPKEARGRGAAADLLNLLAVELQREHGSVALVLYSDVPPRVYERCGFVLRTPGPRQPALPAKLVCHATGHAANLLKARCPPVPHAPVPLEPQLLATLADVGGARAAVAPRPFASGAGFEVDSGLDKLSWLGVRASLRAAATHACPLTWPLGAVVHHPHASSVGGPASALALWSPDLSSMSLCIDEFYADCASDACALVCAAIAVAERLSLRTVSTWVDEPAEPAGGNGTAAEAAAGSAARTGARWLIPLADDRSTPDWGAPGAERGAEYHGGEVPYFADLPVVLVTRCHSVPMARPLVPGLEVTSWSGVQRREWV